MVDDEGEVPTGDEEVRRRRADDDRCYLIRWLVAWADACNCRLR
jgi:hypothetical protein